MELEPLSEAEVNAWTSPRVELSMLEAHAPYPSPVSLNREWREINTYLDCNYINQEENKIISSLKIERKTSSKDKAKGIKYCSCPAASLIFAKLDVYSSLSTKVVKEIEFFIGAALYGFRVF